MADTWRQRAACRGARHVTFVASIGTPAGVQTRNESEALGYCARCPVTAECHRDAVAHGDDGVWGATTGLQRRIADRTNSGRVPRIPRKPGTR